MNATYTQEKPIIHSRSRLPLQLKEYDYFKSPEGEAAYEEIGMPYPEEVYDDRYNKFLKLTKNTKERLQDTHWTNETIHTQIRRAILDKTNGGIL